MKILKPDSVESHDLSDNLEERARLLQQSVDYATLDRFEKEHRLQISQYEKKTQVFQLENYLTDILSQRLMPLTNRVLAINRLVDQVIANVDKHED